VTRAFVHVTFCFACVWSLGCNSAPSGPPPAALPTEVHDHGPGGHDHAHGHSHGHADTGPNGGHLVEFQSEDYHAEWLHDDESGKVTVFILDKAAKTNVPIANESITIEKKIGEKSEKYQLMAQRADGETKTAKFEIVDKPLIEALKSVGHGIEAIVSVEIDGKAFTGKFEHHDHGDHGHGHKH
jgi:hypothetical protein